MNYSIITPTKDEAKYIEQTILSVVNQLVLPLEWYIMDDGSTDKTCEIVQHYASRYPFIKYVFLDNFRPDLKNTGGRVAAIINYGDSLRTLPCDVLSKIDADTSFPPDFYKNILHEFELDPQLGLASGHLVENGIPEKITDPNTGRGANLNILYTCFQKIGKFFVSKTRGEDSLAYVAVRSLNMKTRTFDYYFNHLKPEGIRKSPLKNALITGYYKGSIPYWLPFFLLTVIRDCFRKPYFIRAIATLGAYIQARYIHNYRPFPDFVTKHLIFEQKQKFTNQLTNQFNNKFKNKSNR